MPIQVKKMQNKMVCGPHGMLCDYTQVLKLFVHMRPVNCPGALCD